MHPNVKEFTHPSKGVFTIAPYDDGTQRQALKEIQKKGLAVRTGENDLLALLELDLASAKLVLQGWKRPDGSDATREEIEALCALQKARSWVLAKSRELAEANDQDWDGDKGK